MTLKASTLSSRRSTTCGECSNNKYARWKCAPSILMGNPSRVGWWLQHLVRRSYDPRLLSGNRVAVINYIHVPSAILLPIMMMIWCKENSQLVVQFSELKDRIGSILMSIRKRLSKTSGKGYQNLPERWCFYDKKIIVVIARVAPALGPSP